MMNFAVQVVKQLSYRKSYRTRHISSYLIGTYDNLFPSVCMISRIRSSYISALLNQEFMLKISSVLLTGDQNTHRGTELSVAIYLLKNIAFLH